jgi:hypothetical protein
MSAAIVFTQSSVSSPAGQSAFGVAGVAVTVSNGGTSAPQYRFTLIWTPIGSALSPGIVQFGSSPSWTFTPDVMNGYTVQLDLCDSLGNTLSTDVRMFGIKRASGRFIPGFCNVPPTMNFGGNQYGWAPYEEMWLDYLDGLTSGTGNLAVVASVALINGVNADITIPANANVIELTGGGASAQINGFVYAANVTCKLVNLTGNPVLLKHEDTANEATARNRLYILGIATAPNTIDATLNTTTIIRCAPSLFAGAGRVLVEAT